MNLDLREEKVKEPLVHHVREVFFPYALKFNNMLVPFLFLFLIFLCTK